MKVGYEKPGMEHFTCTTLYGVMLLVFLFCFLSLCQMSSYSFLGEFILANPD